MHPADEIEPELQLKSVGDFSMALFAALPGGPSLAQIRAGWKALAGNLAERSWPARLENGTLYIEASGTAAQDLRLMAGGIRKKLAEAKIPLEKVVVEAPAGRVQNDPRASRG